jgi:hypothetical protein
MTDERHIRSIDEIDARIKNLERCVAFWNEENRKEREKSLEARNEGYLEYCSMINLEVVSRLQILRWVLGEEDPFDD